MPVSLLVAGSPGGVSGVESGSGKTKEGPSEDWDFPLDMWAA